MTTRPLRAALGLLVPFALVVAACGDDEDEAGTDDTTADTTATTTGGGGEGCAAFPAPDGAPEITIGAQDFGESAILAEIYGQCLEAAGYSVSVQELGGFRDIELQAFDAGDINFAPEYAASMLEALNEQAGEATSDAAETTDLLNGYLVDLGLVALTPSEAVDTNGFVVTSETADELGLAAISDLADHPDLVLGAPADCETNPFCLPGLERVYGIDLSTNYIALEPAAVVAALDSGDIDVGLIFSTDARIVVNEWVLLDDDQSMLAADNVVPVLTTELGRARRRRLGDADHRRAHRAEPPGRRRHRGRRRGGPLAPRGRRPPVAIR
jgi:osmoprotectant transport system substrate-binding protein